MVCRTCVKILYASSAEQRPERDDVPFASLKPDDRRAAARRIVIAWVELVAGGVEDAPAKQFGRRPGQAHAESRGSHGVVYEGGKILHLSHVRGGLLFLIHPAIVAAAQQRK